MHTNRHELTTRNGNSLFDRIVIILEQARTNVVRTVNSEMVLAEQILNGNVSKRRNPLIAELLRRIQMVEAWGRGMPLILKNVPDAKFREVAQIFIACFDRPSFVKSDDQSTPVTKRKTKGKAEALLNFLATHLSATIPEMAAELNLTENGVNYHLRKLQQTNRLKRIGGRKQAHWQLR